MVKRIEPRPLPSCVASEDAVLTSLLIQRVPIEDLEDVLNPGLFLDPQNRILMRGVVALRAKGLPVDIPAIKDWVQNEGLASSINPDDVQRKLDMTPFVSNVREHADHILDVARVRQTIATAQLIAAEGYSVNGESSAFLQASVQRMTEATNDTRAAAGFRIISGAAIMAKLDPIKWVIPELCIGPGRPTLVPGYGYSLKSFALQSLAISVATGEKVWGEFRCTKGKVLHLDYEQGEYATRQRYQRLAFASIVAPERLEGQLCAVCFPEVYLTTAGAEATLRKVCEGFSLCIIDSFKACTPGVEEKDSGIRMFLDMLTRISERTGCSFIVIHHAGKSNPDRDKKESARGSSAIFDACGTVITMTGKEAFEPVRVELTKTSAAATGRISKIGFYLSASDISSVDGANDKAGILIEYQPDEAVEHPGSPKAGFARLHEAIGRLLDKYPQGLSTRDVIAFMRGEGTRARAQDVCTALRMGSVEGRYQEGRGPGSGHGKVWTQPRTSNRNGDADV